MLCSVCKKNTAVIFINKQGQDGKTELEGLCYDCAKKRGINPIDTMAKQANLSDKDIQELTNKLDDMFKNLSVNMNDIDEDELSDMMNEENTNGEDQGQGVPLGSIFSGIFGIRPNNEAEEESSIYASNGTQKVKEKTDNDGIVTDEYPLVMDAPLSSFDQKRIKNICEVIPGIARQVIIFIKDSDGNIAKNEMTNKIGIEYEVSLKNKEMPVDSKITKVGEF